MLINNHPSEGTAPLTVQALTELLRLEDKEMQDGVRLRRWEHEWGARLASRRLRAMISLDATATRLSPSWPNHDVSEPAN